MKQGVGKSLELHMELEMPWKCLGIGIEPPTFTISSKVMLPIADPSIAYTFRHHFTISPAATVFYQRQRGDVNCPDDLSCLTAMDSLANSNLLPQLSWLHGLYDVR